MEEETPWIVAGLVAECTVLIGQNVRDRQLIGSQPPEREISSTFLQGSASVWKIETVTSST
jgi:hypothetical protein